MTLKVAHITPSFYPAFAYGGPTESMYRLSLAAARQGADVRVLTTDANGRHRRLEVPQNQEIKMAERVSVRYCRRQYSESISAAFLGSLLSYVHWADVIHLEAIYSFPTFPTLWSARLFNKPIMWSARGALARWQGTRRQGLKSVYDRLCRISSGRRLLFHFTSDQEMKESLKRFPGSKGIVVPNGVLYPESIAPVERKDVLRLLYLGRLDPIKGIENLLRACKRFDDSWKGRWQLTVAGQGEAHYTSKLKRLIGELGLAETVQMIGYAHEEEKKRIFAEADVVIAPSYLENFCMVVAEALAHGVPVIASRGTPWAQLEPKGCGLWVDNTPESLADAVARMANMPLRSMGEKGRAWVKTDFSWDTIGSRMMDVYQQMLKEGS